MTFPMPDRIGRWRTHAIFGTGSLIAQVTLLKVPIYWVRLPAMIMLGSMMIKNSLAYIWGFEITHSRHKSFASSTINLVDFSNAAIAGCFFLFVENDWYALYSIWVALSAAAYLTLLCFCTESPKWLLMQGRTKEAIDSLNYIAWFNGSVHRIPADTDFIEAPLSSTALGNPSRQKLSGALTSEFSFDDLVLFVPDDDPDLAFRVSK